MKKIVLVLLALVSLSVFGQKKQKIKGNREVLIKKFTVPSFSALEVGEKFEIGLEKTTDTTRVVIETDDNLFDVIHFSVEDGVLKFSTSMEIVKKKRLKITLYVPEHFDQIRLIEKGKVYSEEELTFDNMRIEAIQKGRADLRLRIRKNLAIEATDKTSLEMEVAASEVTVHLAESAELKAKMNAKTIEVVLDDHALAKLEGDAKQLKLDAKSKSEFKANNFTVTEAVVYVSDKATAKINVTGNVVLKLSGESETYLYGSPKINLKNFKDNAVLYKK